VFSPVFLWKRLLTLEILQLHALRSSLHRFPYRTLSELTTPLVAPIVFRITPLHGPRRNTPFPTVTQLLCAYSLQRERVYRAHAQKRSLFTESPLSNGSIRHNIMSRIFFRKKVVTVGIKCMVLETETDLSLVTSSSSASMEAMHMFQMWTEVAQLNVKAIKVFLSLDLWKIYNIYCSYFFFKKMVTK
jgi:hypothetical protein